MRESQWEGTCRVGLRAIFEELSIEEPLDSTSTSYLAAKAVMEESRVGLRSLHGHRAARILTKKVRSVQ